MLVMDALVTVLTTLTTSTMLPNPGEREGRRRRKGNKREREEGEEGRRERGEGEGWGGGKKKGGQILSSGEEASRLGEDSPSLVLPVFSVPSPWLLLSPLAESSMTVDTLPGSIIMTETEKMNVGEG